MKKTNINIPKESYSLVSYTKDNLPAIAVINKPLLKFKPKEAFSFGLCLSIEFKEANDVGFPAKEELPGIEEFEDNINVRLKGDNETQPNVLFLARITWNRARDLFYRVSDPEKAHSYLQSLIQQEDFPIKFDYIMQSDKKWEMTKWLPKLLKGK